MTETGQPRPQPVPRTLALELARVTERAAVAAARLRGKGDEKAADQAAVDAMRAELSGLPIAGTVVIGEGERDEAPMLFIGERVGQAAKGKSRGENGFPKVDIAVDPLEGTTLCATGAPNALAVLAASTGGGLLHAPDLYMDKLVVGPTSKDKVDLDKPVAENLRTIADALGRKMKDLVVVVLDRDRHAKLIADISRVVYSIQR